jgi:hypothetical protein
MLSKKTKVIFGILMCMIFLVSAAFCQEGVKKVASPEQAKLMAKRAAQEDAYRNLAETIYGIELESQTTVKDFITQSDTIKSRVTAVIRGATVVRTDWKADGTCEVEMHLKVITLQKALQKQFAYAGDTIKAIGYGAPNPVSEDEVKKVTEETKPKEDDWSVLIIKATGSGAPPKDVTGPQSRLLAQRAAQMDAMRNLGENILGVEIKSKTIVKDFVTQNDEIKSKFEGFIQGAKVTQVRELEDGTVEVDVEIALIGLKPIIEGAAKK